MLSLITKLRSWNVATRAESEHHGLPTTSWRIRDQTGLARAAREDIYGGTEREIPYVVGFENWTRFMTALMLMIEY